MYVIGKDLAALKHAFAVGIFGMSLDEAHCASICIDCKQPVDKQALETLDRKEYETSGMCPKCFNKVAK